MLDSRHIKLTSLDRFFFYWSQNEEARLKRDLDNTKYSHIVPVTFEDFFETHKDDELASAAYILTLETWMAGL